MNTKLAPTVRMAFAIGALLLAAYPPLSVAAKSHQPTYSSAEEASHALFLAVQNHDERSVAEILQAGPSPLSADEEIQDRLDRERFAQKYQEMHRFTRQADGRMVLYIGAENWPFPIPLVSRNGAWRFDSDTGAHEIRYRRIGENELTAIALCQALVSQSHPGADGSTDARTAAVLAAAKSGGGSVPFHGYYFRTVMGSGNSVAALAYPVAYRSSGVMTFAVDAGGVTYEKDLGPNTAKIAGSMTGYRIDRTWTSAEAMN
jgi:Protein of unknown function (DUF2950)